MTKPQNLTQLAEQNKKVQQELDSLKKEYQYLADRHDALFKLNRLLSECKDIRDFYFQVHNVVASLMYLDTLSIITGELVLPTATDLEHHGVGLPLVTNIVLHPPAVPPHWQHIRVQHGQCEVCVVIVVHHPLVVCCVVCYGPALWSNILPVFRLFQISKIMK